MEAKCAIAGCKIPARGEIKSVFFTLPWSVCGNHRKELAVLINSCSDDYLEDVRKLRLDICMRVVDGIEHMGDHRAEDELSLAT